MPANAVHTPSAFLAIFCGGLLCGVFDITQAIIAFRLQAGVTPTQVLQSVASGLLGRSSFQGGVKTALLGGFLHFLIAVIWATFYYIVSRKLTVMLDRPILCGLLYGEFVWLVMTFVVLPLSAIHRWPTWNAAQIITGPIGHTVLVGLPIALAVRRYS
jgi:uncharacterized membrane protein YagU involved in acid resistance